MPPDAEWNVLTVRHSECIARNPSAKFSLIDPELIRAVQSNRLKSYCTDPGFFKLSRETFAQILTILLNAEQIHREIEMRRHDQQAVKVALDKKSMNPGDKPLFNFTLPGLSKGQPKLVPGDFVILDNGSDKPEQFCVERVVGDVVQFRRFTYDTRKVAGPLWNLSFHSRGIPSERCVTNLRAIEGWEMLKQMLFIGGQQKDAAPSRVKKSQQVAKVSIKTSDQQMNARLSKCNAAQRQAILNIMEAKCRPNLYIIFGPPGTGKSHTLVEAVVQIFQRELGSRLLVCANSNNCANDLATKLLATSCIKSKELVRLCGVDYYKALKEKADLVPVPEFFTDEPDKCDSKRAVLTTNIMAFKLRKKFDYVFLDEAGHAHIPESLVPCSRVKDDGCFVLAGDPKQLGPVVHSFEAGKLGLNVSLIKRMFSEFPYGKHGGKYNERYITKLVDAYRCDPRILGLNNELFYQGELNCMGRTPPSILALLSNVLGKRSRRAFEIKNPLIFLPTRGQETRPDYSKSRQNEVEADACISTLFMLYHMGFEPEQIGVIAYYGLQKALLIEKLEERLKRERSLPLQLRLDYKFKAPESRPQKSAENELTVAQSAPVSKRLSYLEQMLLQAKRQLSNLKKSNSSCSASRRDWHCMIDTIDAFQGREKEVIIISTTRTPLDSSGVSISHAGFITDTKHFNVAISRAKWVAMVIGHPAVTNTSEFWRKFQRRAQIVRP